MNNKKLTLADLIESEYRETDQPALILHESKQVEKIVNYLLEELTKKEVLKISFNDKKKKEFTQEIKEDSDFIDLFDSLQDKLLVNIINNIGTHVISQEEKDRPISDLWLLPQYKNKKVKEINYL